MNKKIVILGIIIVIIGIGLMVYGGEKVLVEKLESRVRTQLVSREKVASLEAQGWERVSTFEEWMFIAENKMGVDITQEGYQETLSKAYNKVVVSEGGSVMVREAMEYVDYYVPSYPCRTDGAIVALIGSVTSIIGTAIKEANNPTHSNN